MLQTVREPMSGIDLAWLRMESATTPMMVVAILTLASPISVSAVRELIERRLLRFARFTQRPIHDLTGTDWQTDPQFTLDTHVHGLVLPARAGQRQLESAASELASTRLDPAHPLWQIHVVERYRRGSAIIARFHHCYGDGAALVRVLGSLADQSRRSSPAPAEPTQAPLPSPASWLLVGPAVSLAEELVGGAFNIVSASLHALAHPSETAVLALQVSNATRELARIATLGDEPPTSLKGRLGVRKQVAWAATLKLDEVKTIGHALDSTVNDVLLTSVAGALGHYLRERESVDDDLVVRALVPINLRPLEPEPALGNRFGLVFANLPIGERDPLARLMKVHRDMENLKHSAQPLISLWLLTAMGMLPGVVETQAIDLFTSKATLVISNVPGPQHPLFLAGARIKQPLFWVPQAGRIGIGISLLTYNGRVHFGVMADDKLIADPRGVTQAFATEFEKLLLCVVSMQPGARHRRPPRHA
jgi:WS/DGAT/MGAT family acyltransferase